MTNKIKIGNMTLTVDDIAKVFKQQLVKTYDVEVTTGCRVIKLTRQKRVTVTLSWLNNNDVNMGVFLYEPATNCFNKTSHVGNVKIDGLNDIKTLVDTVYALFDFDPAYKPLPFKEKTFRCNDTCTFVSRTNVISSARVTEIVGVNERGHLMKHGFDEAWFRIECTTFIGATLGGDNFTLLFNGESWMHVKHGNGHLTNTMMLDDGTNLIDMNVHDKELLTYLAEHFVTGEND